ncbi:hypothetical protein [Algoriphagus confluentis]|uniref:DUF1080 domain-containing protein n=1 Tax=Algoriphagus confluentis TaxID=1697556 RepID=A0ABQ6PW96_9BACT|nr:hypothetical protein Aconfl_41400 [Algoriphagus confluentis]
MKSIFLLIIVFISLTSRGNAQDLQNSSSLLEIQNLTPVRVNISEEFYQGKKSLKVVDAGENTEVKFLKINHLNFKDGIIEIDLTGKPAENSSEQARGFVGIAFRINQDNSKFECIYLRPTNGRAQDQVRRNHSVQYISFPDYPWQTLRREFPEKYESYVDLEPGVWTKVRIEVKGNQAKLFVHGNAQPTLLINDLKHGPDQQGSIGLWIGPGTEAYFTNLVVSGIE